MNDTTAVTIRAVSNTGLDHPKFRDDLPSTLDIREQQWAAFIAAANEAVKYSWNLRSVAGFFCNVHNKQVARRMEKFCRETTLLPANVQISYQMIMEKKYVRAVGYAGGSGATLETYHVLALTIH